MKFGFINPRVGLFNEYNVIAETAETIPTIGNFTYRDEMTPPEISLLHMASYARNSGFTPVYIDFNLDSDESILNDLDYAVINLTTHQAKEGYRISELLRNYQCCTAFFGPHATALPEEALKYGNAVFIGEGETGFLNWIANFEDGSYGPYPPINLDELPNPAYEILTPSNHRLIPVISSRGCNRGCTYCWQILTALNKFRTKSPHKVLENIEYARSCSDTQHFLFMDDNMFIDINHGKSILKAIEPLNIRWSCQTDTTISDYPELIIQAKKSGCMRMLIGFESINAESMDKIAHYKSKKIKEFEYAINMIQKNGISIVGSFILGFDYDTKEGIEELEAFLNKNILANVSISILAPPPGTPLFKELKKENRLLTEEWERFNQCSIIFKPHSISEDDLINGVKNLFKTVHSKEMRRKRIKHFLELSRTIM